MTTGLCSEDIQILSNYKTRFVLLKGHSSESSSPSPSLRFTVFTSIKALSLFYRRSVLLSYMNFCLFLCMRWHFEMVVYSKRKKFAPRGAKFFLFRVDPYR